VAKNLNLTFSDLQTKMASESLGKAIQDLGGPNVNAKSEAKKANKQASQDLNAAQSAS
jgi:ABC-type hemin transport system substrate-binding protein